MLEAKSMNYVYSELQAVYTAPKHENVMTAGNNVVALYLELEPNRSKSECRIIPLAQAQALRDDLNRILEQAGV